MEGHLGRSHAEDRQGTLGHGPERRLVARSKKITATTVEKPTDLEQPDQKRMIDAALKKQEIHNRFEQAVNDDDVWGALAIVRRDISLQDRDPYREACLALILKRKPLDRAPMVTEAAEVFKIP